MKRMFIFLSTLFFAFQGMAQQPDTINQRVFLLGDAGELVGNGHPVIDWLKKNVDWDDEKNTILYLGDNIYPYGLPLEGEPSYPLAKRILDYEISLVKNKKAKAFFIPGNHDWRNGKLGGWEQAINQQDYINTLDQKNIKAWPLNGCPGPIPIELTDKIVLALVDSQWFLYLHDKPGPGSNCEAKTIDEFQTQLGEIAASHPNQLMIVALHHPVFSYGVHGGDYTWKEHIFPLTAINPSLYIPLPVLGSIYPLTRGVFGNVQDLKHPLYKTMANLIIEELKKHPNPIVVSGHDHSLQMIMRDSIPYIVSGAGVNSTRASEGKYKMFSDVTLGFSVIEVWNSGKVDVKFYNIQSGSMKDPTFSTQLKDIRSVTAPATVDTTRPIFDSIHVEAADIRLKGNAFKKFLIGRNYRREWTQPISIRVLDLSKEFGGMKPTKQGGGKQTKSLRVKEDSSGKEWALRSIVKNPEAAIPVDLRQTFVKDVVRDGISASYPYGALSMETFSKAAGIPFLRNRLVFLPDDPRLDRFRGDFKNQMALMEEREPDGVKKTDNTDELVLKLAKDYDDHVDQKAVLRARLLDNYVMDLDRHEGQWLWATRDTGKGKIYYPIPKDRDQVFYINQGLLPRLIRKPWLVPELQGFRAKALNIKTFNRAARNFDRTFLTELNKDEWKKEVDTFLRSMTDEVIDNALKQQPPEIQQYSTQKITKLLKKRRQYFATEMNQYYNFLARNVTIIGTNQKDQFTVTKKGGQVRVVIHKIRKDGVDSAVTYDRTFDPGITKELWIYGLNNDDRFIVDGGNSRIKVRMVGGSGNDTFINNGSGKKVLAYDVLFENNEFTGSTPFRKTEINDPQVNRYNRLNFKYNYVKPGLAFEYNIDDGLFLGADLQYVKQGFRKEPYSMRHYALGSGAFKTGSLHFMYQADFIKVYRNNDILIRADFRAPVNVTNFFGIGNNTVFDKARPNKTYYYRARYDISNISVYLRRQLQSWMRINVGPTFQYFTLDSSENANRFVSTQFTPLNKESIYSKKTFFGADLRLDINSKNNERIPSRGFVLDMGARPLFGVNKEAHNVIQTNVDMRIYMSLYSQTKLVLAMRFGWAKNYGKYDFPQAMYLGGTENLRGFRKQRFAGRSMLFNNTELRVKLLDFTTYLFPSSLGLLAFNDVGRVWADGQRSQKWHYGYGGGIWIAPIKRFVLALSLAHSQEEKILPRLTFGFQF